MSITDRHTSTRHASARFHFGAAIWAGLIAGVVFMMVEMAMLMMMGQSPWGPPRMMGAIILGRDALPPPATFDMGIMAAAMGVHLPLSVLYGLVFAVFASRLTLWPAVAAGAVFGVVIYGVNFYAMTSFFLWFAEARGMGSLVGHALFGAVLAFSYKKLAH